MNKHIFWISSYPKSGNTLIRAILTGLFFSDDGKVSFQLCGVVTTYTHTPGGVTERQPQPAPAKNCAK